MLTNIGQNETHDIGYVTDVRPNQPPISSIMLFLIIHRHRLQRYLVPHPCPTSLKLPWPIWRTLDKREDIVNTLMNLSETLSEKAMKFNLQKASFN